jgi:hypothetical protein
MTFFLVPRIYYHLTNKFSVNSLKAWRLYIVFNLLLTLISPIIIGFMGLGDINEAINAYISVPFLSLSSIIVSASLLYIFYNEHIWSSKISLLTNTLVILNILLFWLTVIFMKAGNLLSEGIVGYLFGLLFFYLFFNPFGTWIDVIVWNDIFSGKFEVLWSLEKVKKVMVKGNELYDVIPEFKKMVDGVTLKKSWGNRLVTFNLSSVDESYQKVYEWIRKKTFVVYLDKPNRIIARKSFVTGGRYNALSDKIPPVFLDCKVGHSGLNSEITLSIYPVDNYNIIPKIYEQRILDIINDFSDSLSR